MKKPLLSFLLLTALTMTSSAGPPLRRFDRLDGVSQKYVIDLLTEGLLVGYPSFIQSMEPADESGQTAFPQDVSSVLGLLPLLEFGIVPTGVQLNQIFVYQQPAIPGDSAFPQSIANKYRFPRYFPTLFCRPKQTMFAVLLQTNSLDIAALDPRFEHLFQTIYEDVRNKTTERFLTDRGIDVSVTNSFRHIFPGCIFDVEIPDKTNNNKSPDAGKTASVDTLRIQRSLEARQNIALTREELFDILLVTKMSHHRKHGDLLKFYSSLFGAVPKKNLPETNMGRMLWDNWQTRTKRDVDNSSRAETEERKAR